VFRLINPAFLCLFAKGKYTAWYIECPICCIWRAYNKEHSIKIQNDEEIENIICLLEKKIL